MPMYEYRCSKCEIEFEEMRKFSDAPLTDCERCGSAGTITKLISKSSFALKGTGWYTTDYKKSSAPAASSTEVKSETPAPAGAPAAVKAAATESPTAKPAAAPSPSKSNKAD